MKKNEITQLDGLFQIILLNKYDYNSIIGGTADCIHHQIILVDQVNHNLYQF